MKSLFHSISLESAFVKHWYLPGVHVWRSPVKRISFFSLLIFFSSTALWAHHGNAAFDTTKTLTMKATVTEWVWANPHCWLKFDVKDENGNVVHWTAETSNPPDMVNRGWAKGSFKPGDEIAVTLIPVKNGQPIGRVQQVTLPGGQTLIASPVPPKPAENAPKP
jgi:hypothetical protein